MTSLWVTAGQWVEFDDEKPILRKEEDITALSGGGEDIGYLPSYRHGYQLCVVYKSELHVLMHTTFLSCFCGGFAGDWHMAYILVYKARTVAMS